MLVGYRPGDLRRAGCRRRTVYGGSRTICDLSWTHLPLDITDQGSVDAAVAEVLRRESRLDGLVACAGMGLAGSLEDTDDDEAKRQFDTNFFGTTRTIRAVLPVMRKQASGKIVVIGSIGGLIGLPFVAYYSASKFALDGLVEALRGEVAPFGVQATIVHPGDINTAFGANRVFGRNVGDASAYQARFQDTLRFYAAQEHKGASPDALARTPPRSLPARVVVGTPLEKLGVSGKRYLPGRSFEYLMRKAYSASGERGETRLKIQAERQELAMATRKQSRLTDTVKVGRKDHPPGDHEVPSEGDAKRSEDEEPEAGPPVIRAKGAGSSKGYGGSGGKGTGPSGPEENWRFLRLA